MKNGRALNVPLSALAVRIMRSVMVDPMRPKQSRFMFTTTGTSSVSGFRKGKDRLDRYIAETREQVAARVSGTATEMPHWTIHDLRSTFATRAADRLGIDIAVVDRTLNHVATATTSKIARNYNMSELFEPRRHASNAWAALLESEVIGDQSATVL